MAASVTLTLGVALACGDDDDNGATPTAAATPTPEATATLRPDDATPTPTPPPATTEAGIELDEFVIRPEKTRARPGTVVFQVRNAGEVAHQFLVVRSDLPIAQLPRKPGDAGVDETQIDVVGRIDGIPPDGEDEVSVEVASGQYVLICNLFSQGNSHYLQGMYTRFEVTPAAPDPAQTPQASTPAATTEAAPTQ